MPSPPPADDPDATRIASEDSLREMARGALKSTGAPKGRPGGWHPPSAGELQAMLPGYEVQKFIARGGMGAVYRGVHKGLGRLVAIKILPPELQESDPHFVERFRQEARAMAHLNHPGIVAVYDSGEMGDGTLFFVMEFIEGTDVAQMVAAGGRLPSDHAMAIAAHVCDALQYAHDNGVVHRDIKPANIMVGYDGRVKVADFGLAKVNQAGSTGLTQSGVVMGTLHFMAPEALTLGSAIDHRADIYAVGVMLYQMLTGKVPQGMFEMPSLKVPGLDPRYDAIVAQAMREDRDLRYQQINEMRLALDSIVTEPVPKLDADADPAAALPTYARPQRSPHQPFRPPAPQVVVKYEQRSNVWLWGVSMAVIVALGSLMLKDSKLNTAPLKSDPLSPVQPGREPVSPPSPPAIAAPVAVPRDEQVYSSTWFELRSLKGQFDRPVVLAILGELDKGIERLNTTFGRSPLSPGRKFLLLEKGDSKNTVLGVSSCDAETLTMTWTTSFIESLIDAYQTTGQIKSLPIYMMAGIYHVSARERLMSSTDEKAVVSGLNILVRQIAHEAIGLARSEIDPTTNLQDISLRLNECAREYVRTRSLNWANTISSSSPVKIASLGTGDLYAALLLNLRDEADDDDFLRRVFALELPRLPIPNNKEEAISNLLTAVSRAAGTDLTTYLSKKWKLQEATKPVHEIAAVAALPRIPVVTDLMRLFDAKRDTIGGEWTSGPDGLSVKPGTAGPYVIATEFDLFDEFDYEIEFSSASEVVSSINQFFEVRGRLLEWTMNAHPTWARPWFGFPRLDGIDLVKSPEAAINLPPQLVKDRHYRSVVKVRHNFISGSLDDKELVAWHGDLSRFVPATAFRIPPGHLALLSWAGGATFHKVRVTEYFPATQEALALEQQYKDAVASQVLPLAKGEAQEAKAASLRLVLRAQLSALFQKVVASAKAEDTPLIWTDVKGRTIQARFKSIQGTNVVLEIAGREQTVALALLSPSSQRLAQSMQTRAIPNQGVTPQTSPPKPGPAALPQAAPAAKPNVFTFGPKLETFPVPGFKAACPWLPLTCQFTSAGSDGRCDIVFQSIRDKGENGLVVSLQQTPGGTILSARLEPDGDRNRIIGLPPDGQVRVAEPGKPAALSIGIHKGNIVISTGAFTIYSTVRTFIGSDHLLVRGIHCNLTLGDGYDLDRKKISTWPSVMAMATGQADSLSRLDQIPAARAFDKPASASAKLTREADELTLSNYIPGQWIEVPVNLPAKFTQNTMSSRSIRLGLRTLGLEALIEAQWNSEPAVSADVGKYGAMKMDIHLGKAAVVSSRNTLRLRIVPTRSRGGPQSVLILRHLSFE